MFRFVARPDSYTVKLTVWSPTRSTRLHYRCRSSIAIPASSTSEFFSTACPPRWIPVDLPGCRSGVHPRELHRQPPGRRHDHRSIRLETILETRRSDGSPLRRRTRGVLAMGVQIRADQGTGARIGSTGTRAPLLHHLRQGVRSGDTTLPGTPLTRGISFQTFVSQTLRWRIRRCSR